MRGKIITEREVERSKNKTEGGGTGKDNNEERWSGVKQNGERWCGER